MTGCSCGCGGACGSGGCCAGVRAITPRPVVNRPGLPAIGYRPGSHGDFLESMIARLASRPELAGYTTRDPGDPGIALLDCWALVAAIVAFYAERAANEGYLSTAAQADSLGYLASLVNYQPRPAIGASGYLAFTMDPGSAGTIPAGTAARSVAAQGQPQQTFETAEAIAARSGWNQIVPRTRRPGSVSAKTAGETGQLTFAGTSTGVQPGTRLVFDFGSAATPATRAVTAATPDFTAGTTLVQLAAAPSALDLAWTRLSQAASGAIGNAPSPGGPFAQAVVTILEPIAGMPPQPPAPYDKALYDDQAVCIRQLAEALAIAAGRVPLSVARWLLGPSDPDATTVTDVVTAGTALLTLVEQDLRIPPREVAYLRELAWFLANPPAEVAESAGNAPGIPVSGIPGTVFGWIPEAVLDRAVPLVEAAATLPALRRPPSRPPAAPAALPQRTADALAPASAAIGALLAAADPRLAGLLAPAIARQAVTDPPAVAGVIALRSKAGAQPGDVSDPPPSSGGEAAGGQAPGGQTPRAAPSVTTLTVDGTPDSLAPGAWLSYEQAVPDGTSKKTSTFAGRIATVRPDTRTTTVGPGNASTRVSVPVSVVTLDRYDSGQDATAPITAYFGGVPLQLADEPVTDDVGGSSIALGQAYDGLYPGQRLIVTGERTDIPGTAGVVASELTMAGAVEQAVDTSLPGDTTLPVLMLAAPLAYTYKRDTVTINGNVAPATQGETRTEVLGSGDASAAGQSFPLRQVSAASPLTWLPSDNALGAADTLTVRVGGPAWQETDDLTQAGPDGRAYRTVTGTDGSARVTFGDGLHGSRLPSGPQNVTADYRIGGGAAGNVAAGRITQLASRPLGVNAVTNPLPATGGADGDGPAAVRSSAALRCLALDRLLSVRDYADFTAARAGIGKAAAARLTDGGREVVHVTIAGAGDAPLDDADLLVTTLREALAELGDPFLPVRVAVRELLLLVLSAGVKVDPGYSWDQAEPAVRAAALAAAGFGARALGQPVYLSAIVAAMQAVPGVTYVDVDLFTSLPATANPVELAIKLLALSGASAVEQVIEAAPARFDQRTYTTGNDPTGRDDTLTTIALRYGTTVAALAALNPGLAAPSPAGQLAGVPLAPGTELVISSGIRPAQLAIFRPDVPQTLILRSIP
jgi:predicted phage baseplate assembly protein